jgi:hypothetical protein
MKITTNPNEKKNGKSVDKDDKKNTTKKKHQKNKI